jgi:hypothetical protein
MVVNETVVIHDRGFAVNPGIEPAFIAASIGRPIPEYQVRPRVLAGTASLPNAIEVRAEDLRRTNFGQDLVRQTDIRETDNAIQPAANVPRPQPLAPNEHGRLGQQPPRFAQGARPATNLPQNVQQQGTSIQAPPGRQPNETARTPTAQPGPNQPRLGGTQQGLTPEQQAQQAQQQQAQQAQQQQAAQRAQQQQAAQRAQQQQAAQRAQQQQQAAQRAQQQQAAQRAQQQAQRGQLQGLYGQAHGPGPAAHAPGPAPHGPAPAPGPRPGGNPNAGGQRQHH